MQHSRRQKGMNLNLHLNLVIVVRLIPCLDISYAELVIFKLPLIVGVENADLLNLLKQIRAYPVSQEHKEILYYFLVAVLGFFWRLNSTVYIE